MKKIIVLICLSLLFPVGCASSGGASEEFCSVGDEAICETRLVCGNSYECGTVFVSVAYTDTGELCADTDEANRTAIFEEVAADYDLEINETYSCLNGADFNVPDGQEKYWVETLSEDARLDAADLNYIFYIY